MLFGIIKHLLTGYSSNIKFIVPLANQRFPAVSPWKIVGVLENNKHVITPIPVNKCIHSYNDLISLYVFLYVMTASMNVDIE